MRSLLIVLSVGEAVLLVAVLAGYLIALATVLKKLAKTMASVDAGVHAVGRHSEHVGLTLRVVDEALEDALDAIRRSDTARTAPAEPAPSRRA